MRGRRRAGLLGLAAALLASASLAHATVVQTGDLRLTVLAQIAPHRLPRTSTAPISVFLSGHVQEPNGGIPPQLETMRIDVNRHGLLQSRGLPVCRIPRIQPASTRRALANCGDALIGAGQFWAQIVLPEQGSYPTHGRLLIFNGRLHGAPAILAHIYTESPFDSSFVIAFEIKRIHKGPYGTELTASLPEALGEWGYVNRIKLTLRREYTFRGRRLSYFNAGCPALPGTRSAVFPVAQARLDFSGEESLKATVLKSCGVKGR